MPLGLYKSSVLTKNKNLVLYYVIEWRLCCCYCCYGVYVTNLIQSRAILEKRQNDVLAQVQQHQRKGVEIIIIKF